MMIIWAVECLSYLGYTKKNFDKKFNMKYLLDEEAYKNLTK